MPWSKSQTRFLLSKGSPLTPEQHAKMLAELHSDPSLAHAEKQGNALAMGPKKKR